MDKDNSLVDLINFVRDELDDNILGDAITESVAVAKEGTGQYIWTGVSR